MDRGRGRGEERVGDEVLEADPVLGVPLEQVVEEVGELRRGPAGNPRGQSGISLVELLQSLWQKVLKTDFNQGRSFEQVVQMKNSWLALFEICLKIKNLSFPQFWVF